MVPDKWNQNWHFITTYNLIIPGTCYMYIFEKWWYEILFSCWIYKPQCVGLHFGVWIGMWGILWRWVSSSRLDQRSRSGGRSSPLYWRFLWWPGLYDVCLYWFGFLLWHLPMEKMRTRNYSPELYINLTENLFIQGSPVWQGLSKHHSSYWGSISVDFVGYHYPWIYLITNLLKNTSFLDEWWTIKLLIHKIVFPWTSKKKSMKNKNDSKYIYTL